MYYPELLTVKAVFRDSQKNVDKELEETQVEGQQYQWNGIGF